MLHAHMPERTGKLPRASSDCIILVFRAGRSAAPFLRRCSPVEQPLQPAAPGRIKNRDWVGVPTAVDQQSAETSSDLVEIGRCCESPLRQSATLADKLALWVPQNETSRSAQQFAPNPVPLRRSALKRGRQ